MNELVIDIGGNSVKFLITEETEPQKFPLWASLDAPVARVGGRGRPRHADGARATPIQRGAYEAYLGLKGLNASAPRNGAGDNAFADDIARALRRF